jgi:hypothetical protein
MSMLRVVLAMLAALLPAFTASAQLAGPPRHATLVDLTGAAGSELYYTALAGWRLWGLAQGGRLQAGLGGRVTYFWGPANELDRQNGAAPPAALVVPQPRLLALNLALHLRARVAGPVRLGFNLDLLGASFGPGRTAETTSSAAIPEVRPVRNNVLLGGLADQGTLNSELYASLALPHHLSVRGGWSHVVTAYEVNDTRYRRFRNLAALGLSYQLP